MRVLHFSSSCSVTLSMSGGCCRACRAQLGCCSQWTVTVHFTVQRVYSAVYSGLTPTKSFSPWSTASVCSLASKDELISSERDPAPVATDNNINQSPSHLSSARENKYILLWCCGDRLGLYFQRYFSLLIFCLNILVRKACEKWVYRVYYSLAV